MKLSNFETFWKAALAAGGIGTVGFFVFWSLYQDWLKLPIFADLDKGQTFTLMILFLVFVFVALLAGLIGYVILKLLEKRQAPAESADVDPEAKKKP